ncbi:unnamed protein product [Nippostrongylus brasiliensis]|uniref:Uncharacterized protein n=1 Tax=Nippostrongylus brasiliensis TaxID=27835 RepID=A0A0N4Y8E8_NIPBR|nr:hypothetical protein Q1695_008811 [Nippostrongylus brasiliensis]VDL76084.1 unnamed protein product [Nippostrongylus brasiliensis]
MCERQPDRPRSKQQQQKSSSCSHSVLALNVVVGRPLSGQWAHVVIINSAFCVQCFVDGLRRSIEICSSGPPQGSLDCSVVARLIPPATKTHYDSGAHRPISDPPSKVLRCCVFSFYLAVSRFVFLPLNELT